MPIRIDGDNATATPGITGGDADTGLVFGTDEVSVVTGGTQHVNVNANGDVDLGGLTVSGSAADDSVNIDSSGRLLVGATTSQGINSGLQVVGDTGATIHRGNATAGNAPQLRFTRSRNTNYGSFTSVQNGDELGKIAFAADDGTDYLTQAATITAFVDAAPGANDMPGRLVFSTTADGASSPTEQLRITSNGFVTNKTSSIGSVNGPGFAFYSSNANGYGVVTSTNAPVFYLNRENSDGTLIEFRQAASLEGTIAVSGTTVSYNGGHLSRWSQLANGAERIEILRGSVLSNLDEMCEWIDSPKDAVLDDNGNEVEPAIAGGPQANEQLNRMKVSDVEGDPNVSGVFQDWDDDDDTYTNDFYCAMTGDFIIRIAQGTTVQRGDLLMSAGDGTAKPQDDDIIRSKTIAKVTSTNVSCTYDDGSYCVPCVLMAC